MALACAVCLRRSQAALLKQLREITDGIENNKLQLDQLEMLR